MNQKAHQQQNETTDNTAGTSQEDQAKQFTEGMKTKSEDLSKQFERFMSMSAEEQKQFLKDLKAFNENVLPNPEDGWFKKYMKRFNALVAAHPIIAVTLGVAAGGTIGYAVGGGFSKKTSVNIITGPGGQPLPSFAG